MIHFTSPSFWEAYELLPKHIKKIADKNFEILKINPLHPSLHFKRINKFWSVRAGINYRALSVENEGGLIWFWIGDHSKYDKLIKS